MANCSILMINFINDFHCFKFLFHLIERLIVQNIYIYIYTIKVSSGEI